MATDRNAAFFNFLSGEMARMDSEMKTMAEVVEATEGVEISDAPAVAPGPHGWNLSANTYNPYQGDAFNAFNIADGMDDPMLFNNFTDPDFTKMMEEYFFYVSLIPLSLLPY